jgi:dihydropteroate synthase
MDNKDTYFSSKRTINCSGRLIDLSVPAVMGIINITPDSFYSGSRSQNEDEIVKNTEKHLSEGATFIDVGAYSSKPGAENITEKEEKERLDTALKIIRKKFNDTIISIDTFRSAIAKWAHKEYGINIINDISAGNMDQNMFSTVAELNMPYIMMHMQGTPQNMQKQPEYSNIINDIISFFSVKVRQLKVLGVNDIIIDPGFGFGKTTDHNYHLINKLDAFCVFGLPLLAGVSRKSMVYKFLGNTPEEALNGTTVLNTIAILKGASILRVHDVKEAVEAVKIVQKMKNSLIFCSYGIRLSQEYESN